jgi:hypothetical protein
MKEVVRLSRFVLLGIFIFAGANAFCSPTALETSANTIIKKAVLRAQSVAENTQQPAYSFSKVTVREERDTRGQLKTRKEACDEVLFRNGAYTKVPTQSTNVIKLTGWGAPSTPKPKTLKRDDYLKRLTPDMLDRFNFELQGTTNCSGRTTYVIGFVPKPGAPAAKEFSERIADKTSGTLWIDAEEFELTRAKGSVDAEVTVGGGLLGALKRAVFSVERVRLDNGIWFERLFQSNYEARKLTESKRVTTQTEFRDFRPIL